MMGSQLDTFVSRSRLATAEFGAILRRAIKGDVNLDSNSLDIASLEQRVMLSASPIAIADEISEKPIVAPEDAAASENKQSVAEFSDDTTGITQLVFVDRSASSIRDFLEKSFFSEMDGVALFELDDSRDGIKQMTAEIKRYENLSAIHIISNGNDGQLQLGKNWLTSRDIAGNAADLVSWRDSLSEGADILFYGSNLASSGDGLLMVEAIATLCDCDVAASVDTTGRESQRGDWDQVVHEEAIESQIIVSQQSQQSQQNRTLTPNASQSNDAVLGKKSSLDTETASIANFQNSVDLNETGESTPGQGTNVVYLMPSGGDDTQYIQAIIDAFPTSLEMQWLELGPGNFFISSPIQLGPNIGIRGAGIDVTTITSTSSELSLRIVNAPGAVVQDVTFVASPSQIRMAYVRNSQNVIFDSVRFTGLTEPEGYTPYAMYALRVSNNCDGFTIQNSIFDELYSESVVTGNSLRAIVFSGAEAGLQNVQVLNNTFRNIYAVGGGNTSRDADAICVQGFNTGVDILIDGNTFENAGKRAIKDQVGGLHISNNTMEWIPANFPPGVIAPGAAISLQSTVQEGVFSTIDNNAVIGGFRNAVFTVGVHVSHFTVHRADILNNSIITPSENTHSNMDGIAISDHQTGIVNITNNTFLGWYRWGVNIESADTEVTMTNTTFENASRGNVHVLQGSA